MTIQTLLQELKPYTAEISRLAALKLISGLLLAGSAWEITCTLQGVFLEHTGWNEAAPHLVVLLFLVLLRSLLLLPTQRIADRLSLSVRNSVRHRLHQALLACEPSAPELRSGGSLLTLFLESVDSLDDFFHQVLPEALEALILLPLFFLLALGTDFWTALFFLLTLPIAPLLLYLIGRVTQQATHRQWQQLNILSQEFSELLKGILTLKIFHRSQEQYERLQTLSRNFSTASLQVLQLAFVSAFALELITTLSIALIAVSVGLRLLYGNLTFHTAFFALLIAPEFYHPLRQSGSAFHAGMNAAAAWKSCEHFAAIAQRPTSKTVLTRTTLPPSITFQAVSCHYPGAAAKIIDNLHFFAAAGKLTLLTGSSGSGKSTVLRLILKQLTPTTGNILINDLPLQDIQTDFWHTRTAYVPQEPHLFQGTLRENITLEFSPSISSTNDPSIFAALKAAALLPWLQQLPQGLDTPLGDGAALLSCGQQRRLGLARALWQNAPLLLLDEITAGLDPENEHLILETLQGLRYHHTILMAAHRPAALAAADHIVCLNAGHLESKQDTASEKLSSTAFPDGPNSNNSW